MPLDPGTGSKQQRGKRPKPPRSRPAAPAKRDPELTFALKLTPKARTIRYGGATAKQINAYEKAEKAAKAAMARQKQPYQSKADVLKAIEGRVGESGLKGGRKLLGAVGALTPTIGSGPRGIRVKPPKVTMGAVDVGREIGEAAVPRIAALPKAVIGSIGPDEPKPSQAWRENWLTGRYDREPGSAVDPILRETIGSTLWKGVHGESVDPKWLAVDVAGLIPAAKPLRLIPAALAGVRAAKTVKGAGRVKAIKEAYTAAYEGPSLSGAALKRIKLPATVGGSGVRRDIHKILKAQGVDTPARRVLIEQFDNEAKVALARAEREAAEAGQVLSLNDRKRVVDEALNDVREQVIAGFGESTRVRKAHEIAKRPKPESRLHAVEQETRQVEEDLAAARERLTGDDDAQALVDALEQQLEAGGRRRAMAERVIGDFGGTVIRAEDGGFEVVWPEMGSALKPLNEEHGRLMQAHTDAITEHKAIRDASTMPDKNKDPAVVTAKAKMDAAKNDELYARIEGRSASAALDTSDPRFARRQALAEELMAKYAKRTGALPKGMGDTAQMQKVMSLLDELAELGEYGREWYEESAKAILTLSRGDLKRARKLAQLFAIYSPQQPILGNTSLAFRAYNQYLSGRAITTGQDWQMEAAEKVLSGKGDWAGRKTNNFYLNFLEDIDPEEYARERVLTAAERRKAIRDKKMFEGQEDLGEVTADLWMARAFGYLSDQPSQGRYDVIEGITRLLAEERGWKPKQMQAAIWTAIKDASDDVSANIDFAGGIDRNVAQINYEAASVDPALKAEYDAWEPHVQKAFLIANAELTDAFVDEVGLLTRNSEYGVGVWGDELAPGAQLRVGVSAPPRLKDPKTGREIVSYRVEETERELLDVTTAAIASVLKQDAAAWLKGSVPIALKDANVIQVNLGRRLTEEEALDLFDALNPVDDNFIPIHTDNGFYIKNISDGAVPNTGTDYNFHNHATASVNKIFGDADVYGYAADGELIQGADYGGHFEAAFGDGRRLEQAAGFTEAYGRYADHAEGTRQAFREDPEGAARRILAGETIRGERAGTGLAPSIDEILNPGVRPRAAGEEALARGPTGPQEFNLPQGARGAGEHFADENGRLIPEGPASQSPFKSVTEPDSIPPDDRASMRNQLRVIREAANPTPHELERARLMEALLGLEQHGGLAGPPPGMVRLYRGEGAQGESVQLGDLPERGLFFTPNRELAENYARLNNGQVHSVDVPEAVAREAAQWSPGADAPGHHVLPREWADRKAPDYGPVPPRPEELFVPSNQQPKYGPAARRASRAAEPRYGPGARSAALERQLAEAEAAGDVPRQQRLELLLGGDRGGGRPPDMPPTTTAGGEPPDVPLGTSLTYEERFKKNVPGMRRSYSEEKVLQKEELRRRLSGARQSLEEGMGEAAFESMANQLRGELPKLRFEGFQEMSQEAIEAAFERIRIHPELRDLEKLRTYKALLKTLNGRLPAPNELKLLSKVFDPSDVEDLKKAITWIDRIKSFGINLWNLPRALMSALDFSAAFRQGLMTVRYPRIFARNFVLMVRAFGSQKVFDATQERILQMPEFALMQEADLQVLRHVGGDFVDREEQFLSKWVGKLPGFKGSERAYVGFLEMMRADVFNHLLEKASKQGRKVEEMGARERDHFLKSVGRFVNSATGRGDMGALNKHTAAISAVLWSPRLLWSRLNFLNPVFYYRLDPFARKEAWQSAAMLAGGVASVLGIAKAAGANVEIDPRNADFAKIRVGDTRIDILGGFQQPVRLVSQFTTGKIISSTTGETIQLAGGFAGLSRMDITQRFIRSKSNPAAALVWDMMEGSDFMGEKLKYGSLKPWENPFVQRLIPLMVADSIEALWTGRRWNDPNVEEIPSAAAKYGIGMWGFGTQTYGEKDAAQKRKVRAPSPVGGAGGFSYGGGGGGFSYGGGSGGFSYGG